MRPAKGKGNPAKHAQELNVLNAIPVDAMRRAAKDASRTPQDRQRLANFIEMRWKRLVASEV